MDETEIISTQESKKKVESLSIDELKTYKTELLEMINYIEREIKRRKNERKNAENLFKK